MPLGWQFLCRELHPVRAAAPGFRVERSERWRALWRILQPGLGSVPECRELLLAAQAFAA